MRVRLELARGGAKFPDSSSPVSDSRGPAPARGAVRSARSVKKANALSAGEPFRPPIESSAVALRIPRRAKLNPRESPPEPFEFIRYAAVCRAVAAADRRAAWARALASFWAQSGRTLSVVTTDGSVTDNEVARRRPGMGATIFADDNDEVDDTGEVMRGEKRMLGSAA